MDFEVKKCTRRCAATQREFAPGEPFYSVLIEDQADVIRQDYCLDAWSGPPANALSFWRSQMPDPNAHKIDWAPSDVIVDYFRQLLDRGDRPDSLYVLTLLMLRRRLLRLEETEASEVGQEVLVVYCPKDEQEYQVPVADPTETRIREIQDELTQLLFASGS